MKYNTLNATTYMTKDGLFYSTVGDVWSEVFKTGFWYSPQAAEWEMEKIIEKNFPSIKFKVIHRRNYEVI